MTRHFGCFTFAAMKPQDLLDEFGTASEIARRFGYTRAAVSLWTKAGKVPYRAQLLIQMATMGQFVADRPKKKAKK